MALVEKDGKIVNFVETTGKFVGVETEVSASEPVVKEEKVEEEEKVEKKVK